MDLQEIYNTLFPIGGVDDNNRYAELTGDKINTVQLIEPSLGVSEFVMTKKYMSDHKGMKSNRQTQALAPQLPVVVQDSKPRVYNPLIKEVADTHFKHIRDLMQPAQHHIPLAVYPVVHRLPAYPYAVRQPYITHVFLFITRRRFNCDSNPFLHFIVQMD